MDVQQARAPTIMTVGFATLLGVGAALVASAVFSPFIAIGIGVAVAADGLFDAFTGHSLTGMFLGGRSVAGWMAYGASKLLGGLEEPRAPGVSLRQGQPQPLTDPRSQRQAGPEPVIQRQPLPEPTG